MKRILSIDGGGIFGIIPLSTLKELESDVGPLYKYFDLITGTSTGAIIASMLATGVSVETIQTLYKKDSKKMFKTSWWHKIKTAFGLKGPKYRDGYDEVLKLYIPDNPLCNLMIPSYNLSTGKPSFYKSWRNTYVGTKLYRYVAASMAAPTYFYPYKIDEEYYIDGGMVANNPAMCGYVEAKRLWPDEKIKIVSFGTGETRKDKPKKVRSWGLLTWAGKIVGIMLNGSVDAVDYQLDKVLDSDHYKRIDIQVSKNIEMDDVSHETIMVLSSISNGLMLSNYDLHEWLNND